jgi:hypothetical protein
MKQESREQVAKSKGFTPIARAVPKQASYSSANLNSDCTSSLCSLLIANCSLFITVKNPPRHKKITQISPPPPLQRAVRKEQRTKFSSASLFIGLPPLHAEKYMGTSKNFSF